jgi:hypothetical protein
MTILRMDRHTNDLLLKVSHIKRNKNWNLETLVTPSHPTKKAFMSKGGVHMQFCIQIDVRFRVQFPAQGGKHIHFYLIFQKMQLHAVLMEQLLISRANYRATSARRPTTAHPTVVRRF